MRVRCEAVRYLPTGTLPGVVEVYLTDASGFRWQLVEKTVMFIEFEALEAPDRTFPMEVSIPCRLAMVTRDETVAIDIPQVGDGRVYEVDRAALLADVADAPLPRQRQRHSGDIPAR
jgi:hypothetical protein